MGRISFRLLACPRCGKTLFQIHYAVAERFFHDGSPLTFLMYKCNECGWESHPRSTRAIKRLIANILHGDGDVEGFAFAER